MIKKDLFQKDLARLAGCTESTISHIIKGKRKSKKIQRIIALTLDVPIEKIFPTRRAA